MSWFGGGGGWEERNLKGRLEPGTSVANGSMFDNIRRGWWWGKRGGGGATSWERGGRFTIPNLSAGDEKAEVVEGKIKTGLGIFHQCPTRRSDHPAHKISLRVYT